MKCLAFSGGENTALSACVRSLRNGKDKAGAMSQTCQHARHGCTGPRKCGFTVLQRGLAGGSNSSFLEELQATRLENSLKSGIYLFVFAHVDYVGFIYFFFPPLVVMSDFWVWFEDLIFFFPLHPFLSLFLFFVFFPEIYSHICLVFWPWSSSFLQKSLFTCFDENCGHLFVL